MDAALLPQCIAAIPEDPAAAPQKVYVEAEILNTHRAVGTTISHEASKTTDTSQGHRVLNVGARTISSPAENKT